jgi:predicted acetyltransferase
VAVVTPNIFCDANIVGIIDYISTINEKIPNDSYINLIMIKKDYRSRGLGQKGLHFGLVKAMKLFLGLTYRKTQQ